MTISDASNQAIRIHCESISERDRLVSSAISHQKEVGKSYSYYKEGSQKGIYPDDHLILSFYGFGFFFSILKKEVVDGMNLVSSYSIEIDE